jgi:dGTPase
MDDPNDAYLEEVRAALSRSLEAGLSGLEFWRSLMGADPRLVESIRQEQDSQGEVDWAQLDRRNAARRYAAELPLQLPAADPISSQWWFGLDTVESLAGRARALARDGSAVFLGAPTVGHYYALCYQVRACILDSDPDIVSSVGAAIVGGRTDGWTAEVYDAREVAPERHLGRYAVAVLDPPWYPSLTRLFLSRARQLLDQDGFILCAIPPMLTRPGVVQERTDLLRELLASGYKLVSLESQAVTYEVPPFELAAYQDIPSFTGRPWREGDLLIIQVTKDSNPLPVEAANEAGTVHIFARDPHKLRVFVDERRADAGLPHWAEPVPEFERTVSSRAFNPERITAWGSNRKAIRIRDSSVARTVLEGWARGADFDDTATSLVGLGVPQAETTTAVHEIRDGLGIGDDEPGALRRRTPVQMEEFRRKVLSDLGSQPSKRQYAHKDDDFRLGFQRDRDRVLWSQSLRLLANKTQVFPVDRDDLLRRRLTHSVEVMQLAATIARGFGLDPDLTEAGALAHDLGHPPFGHAGEFALNEIFNHVAPKLGGFNHYEHGADVVRWLEDAYVSPGVGGFPGLNLTRETVECIIKHTYYRRGDPVGQTEVLARSKHRDITDSSGSLEAQAVRIADKLSYLISDLEDGIRLGVITLPLLRACKLFAHPPIDLRPSGNESLIQRFVSQRRALLRVLMEDVLVATDYRLAKLGSSLKAVRETDDYTVAFSPAIQTELDEVWRLLQADLLHRDGRVIQANLQAGATVTRLFLLYMLRPELIDDSFRRAHYRLKDSEYLHHYEGLNGQDSVGFPKRIVSSLAVDRMIGSGLKEEGDNLVVPLYDVILAKDYVASLTDAHASTAYGELLR